MNGETTWTDALDQYASTCAQWARTGEPDTAYSGKLASGDPGFCNDLTFVQSPKPSRLSARTSATLARLLELPRSLPPPRPPDPVVTEAATEAMEVRSPLLSPLTMLLAPSVSLPVPLLALLVLSSLLFKQDRELLDMIFED